MSNDSPSDRAATPTHVGPVALKILRIISRLPSSDRRQALGMVESAIRNRCEEMGAKAYVQDAGDVEYRLEARFHDGVPTLFGTITQKERRDVVGEGLISIVGMPQAKMEGAIARAREGKLRVKDVVSFMTEDHRLIVGGHIDPERENLCLQISYVTHDRVREWPIWSDLVETIR